MTDQRSSLTRLRDALAAVGVEVRIGKYGEVIFLESGYVVSNLGSRGCKFITPAGLRVLADWIENEQEETQ